MLTIKTDQVIACWLVTLLILETVDQRLKSVSHVRSIIHGIFHSSQTVSPLLSKHYQFCFVFFHVMFVVNLIEINCSRIFLAYSQSSWIRVVGRKLSIFYCVFFNLSAIIVFNSIFYNILHINIRKKNLGLINNSQSRDRSNGGHKTQNDDKQNKAILHK